MHLFTKEELIDETHKLMQRSTSFRDLLEAIAINCKLNAAKLKCYPYFEHQEGARDWEWLSDRILAISSEKSHV